MVRWSRIADVIEEWRPPPTWQNTYGGPMCGIG